MFNQTLSAELLHANRLRRQGDYHAAVQRYLPLADRMDDPELFVVIAVCYNALASQLPAQADTHYQQALLWLERALLQHQDKGRIYALMAEIYALGLLDYEQASVTYRKALSSAPHDPWILSSAASLYGIPEAVVTLPEAIEWMEQCVILNPFQANYRLRLSDLYFEAGRLAEMVHQLSAALLLPQPLDEAAMQRIAQDYAIEWV